MSDTTSYRTLEPEAVEALLAAGTELFILDLREPRAYHAGHLPDAVLLPADDFADRYTREISPDDPVLLICEKGLTSAAAAKYLVAQGFTDVATMAGGMTAWTGSVIKKP